MKQPIESSSMVEIRERLLTLIRLTNVLDKETGKIHLNNLWFEPHERTVLGSILMDFMKSLPASPPRTVLLYPEGLLSSFGILPVVGPIADEFKYRLAIWREIGNIVTTSPQIYPPSNHLPQDLPCVILQDVVSKGTTLLKMQQLIHDLNWTVTHYIGVIQIADSQNDLDESIHECRAVLSEDFQFHYLLKDLDIRRT